MAATTTMALLNLNATNSPKPLNASSPKTPQKPISLVSFQNLPKGLKSPKNNQKDSIFTHPLASTALAGAVFSTLSSCDAAFSAQQIAQIAEGDNRGQLLLIVITPAIAWVLYNILQPALNQINKMRSTKGVIAGIGLGGLGALGGGLISPPHASAGEIAAIAEAAAGDNRGQLLLIVITPALAWVAYNILQPALNQINKMRS